MTQPLSSGTRAIGQAAAPRLRLFLFDETPITRLNAGAGTEASVYTIEVWADLIHWSEAKPTHDQQGFFHMCLGSSPTVDQGLFSGKEVVSLNIFRLPLSRRKISRLWSSLKGIFQVRTDSLGQEGTQAYCPLSQVVLAFGMAFSPLLKVTLHPNHHLHVQGSETTAKRGMDRLPCRELETHAQWSEGSCKVATN